MGLKDFRSKYKEGTFLNILSEGDSWHAYPFGDTENLIDFLLARDRSFNILCRASNGDEIYEDMYKNQFKDFKDILGEFKLDIILLSGGGNDIVGDFKKYLKQGVESSNFLDYIDTDAFDIRIAEILVAYNAYISFAASSQKNSKTPILVHTYAYPIPSDRPVDKKVIRLFKKIGPWLYKGLTKRNVPAIHWQNIADFCIDRFALEMEKLAAKYDKFYVCDTRNIFTEGRYVILAG